jgi:ATP synthase subunit 6
VESPIGQFEIHPLLALHIAGYDVSFSNSSMWMMISLAVLMGVFTLGTAGAGVVPGRLQSIAELTYEFIAGMIRDNVGEDGKPFFPYVFTLFVFILGGNLLGMIPYSFTYTSHIIVTFGLAIVTFLGVTLVGIVMHGLHFFSFFRAQGRAGVPAALDGGDRGALLPHPPDQPVGPALRQHDGRAHHAEGVRQLHHHAGRVRRGADRGQHRLDRF